MALKQDFGTLLHDILAHADQAQLKLDLTAVLTDVGAQNIQFSTGTVSSGPAPLNFLDNQHVVFIQHS